MPVCGWLLWWWCRTRNLLGLLQDLYDCMVDVAEDNTPQQHDQASSSDDEQQQQGGYSQPPVDKGAADRAAQGD